MINSYYMCMCIVRYGFLVNLRYAGNTRWICILYVRVGMASSTSDIPKGGCGRVSACEYLYYRNQNVGYRLSRTSEACLDTECPKLYAFLPALGQRWMRRRLNGSRERTFAEHHVFIHEAIAEAKMLIYCCLTWSEELMENNVFPVENGMQNFILCFSMGSKPKELKKKND